MTFHEPHGFRDFLVFHAHASPQSFQHHSRHQNVPLVAFAVEIQAFESHMEAFSCHHAHESRGTRESRRHEFDLESNQSSRRCVTECVVEEQRYLKTFGDTQGTGGESSLAA